jgi:hypothetical protein
MNAMLNLFKTSTIKCILTKFAPLKPEPCVCKQRYIKVMLKVISCLDLMFEQSFACHLIVNLNIFK